MVACARVFLLRQQFNHLQNARMKSAKPSFEKSSRQNFESVGLVSKLIANLQFDCQMNVEKTSDRTFLGKLFNS
jgi:hypothetical protein